MREKLTYGCQRRVSMSNLNYDSNKKRKELLKEDDKE